MLYFQGFKMAYIVFKNASSVKKAKQISYEPARVLSSAEAPLTVGVSSTYAIAWICFLFLSSEQSPVFYFLAHKYIMLTLRTDFTMQHLGVDINQPKVSV